MPNSFQTQNQLLRFKCKTLKSIAFSEKNEFILAIKVQQDILHLVASPKKKSKKKVQKKVKLFIV
ncbi:hypothetical protein BpHYR1_043681 [Brachionus plicatilis]|uniref:Uncharacterized protein n=1 Tax=Brachionus plicatilis TaxID=10195 RepID=A0A3M7RQI3_BRAPC|nr:hypothetical protein BpHYR1_043681 [Brachionus plicatilis]